MTHTPCDSASRQGMDTHVRTGTGVVPNRVPKRVPDTSEVAWPDGDPIYRSEVAAFKANQSDCKALTAHAKWLGANKFN
jgi:hypothetical protein